MKKLVKLLGLSNRMAFDFYLYKIFRPESSKHRISWPALKIFLFRASVEMTFWIQLSARLNKKMQLLMSNYFKSDGSHLIFLQWFSNFSFFEALCLM